MALRSGFYRWLIPAAFVLPFWLFVGWIISGASALSLQLILTLLVRARGTARAERAVSWTDLGVVGAWHALVISLGFFGLSWWWPLFGLTVAVGIAALWVVLAQLWREARPAGILLRTPDGLGYVPAARPERTPTDAEVIVVHERGAPPAP